MLFGQISFHCPVDGQMMVGFDCVEDMVVHRRGHADISVRCPKCGTLIEIRTQAPIIPRPIVEAISHDFGIPFEDGKLTISRLVGSFPTVGMGSSFEFMVDMDEDDCEFCERRGQHLLEEHSLTEAQEKQIGFFASELDKIASVDEFLERVQEDTDIS